MPDLRHTRKNLKIALGIMVAVDLIAIAIYVSPLIGSTDSRRQELNRLQTELNTKTRQVAPLENLPHKVVLASRQISDFYRRRFPTNESEIPTELGKLASPSGVTIEQVRYKVKEEGAGRLIPVEIEADLAGNYTNLAKFINAVERDEMFFIINSVSLGGDPQGPIKLSVKLETYLKVGT